MNYSFIEIAWMFLVYSVIGWMWETPFVSIKEKKFINRGFLRGPLIPIYGFAVTTVMLSMSLIERYLDFHPIVNTVLVMGYIALIATVWEYATSWLMEALFKTRWWNYANHRFNIKGRIALDASLFWGLGGFVLWRFVNTTVLELFESLQGPMFNTIFSLVYLLVVIDTGLTVFELINLRNVVIKLHNASEEVLSQLALKIEQLGDNIEAISDNVTENIFEQRLNFANRMTVAKESLKTRVQYRKYEGFQYFGDFLEDMISKWKTWLDDSDRSLTHFGELLGKVKGQSRFFHNYPNASTKFFELMFAMKKQEDTENEWDNKTDNITENKSENKSENKKDGGAE